ncbi:MAG: type II toxin-antitoxin system prevent-host-death family antitoxin [Microbacterium sp.]
MNTVSAYEAKTHLSALLERAEAGDAITITKHGRPVARLTPIGERRRLTEVVDDLRRFRASLGTETFDIRALVEDGRRY